MGMPARAGWTVDMLESLPDDGQRYEIIDGELFVTPAPARSHQLVLAALFSRLEAYLRASTVGRLLFAPVDVRRGPKRNVQPDLLAVRLDALRANEGPFDFSDVLLVVEALSPTTARADWHVKRPLYQSVGIPQYWLVDIDARSIHRWLPSDDRPQVLADRIEWQPVGMDVPLVIDIVAMFREALED